MRRLPLIRTVRVFVVLLRQVEMILVEIRRRRTPPRRRPALIRRLKLAALYLEAILVDLRLASRVIRARTGSRVFNMLQLGVRAQRRAVQRTIHATQRHPATKKPTGSNFNFKFIFLFPSFMLNRLIQRAAKSRRLKVESIRVYAFWLNFVGKMDDLGYHDSLTYANILAHEARGPL